MIIDLTDEECDQLIMAAELRILHLHQTHAATLAQGMTNTAAHVERHELGPAQAALAKLAAANNGGQYDHIRN